MQPEENATLIFNQNHVKSYTVNSEGKAHASKLAAFQELTKTFTLPSHRVFKSLTEG